MEFYIVEDEKIQLSNNLTQNDIVFILDGKAGYIWKGTQAVDLDETTAKKVETLIQQTFHEVEFGLIPNTEILESDDPKIVQIKTEIINRLPKLNVGNIGQEIIKNYIPSIFKKIKDKIVEFKEYETSKDWRMKLSNLTNVWKLSIFNIVIIGLSILLIFSQSLFHFTIGDYYPLFALIGLLLILTVNIIFVIFPMKFPINVLGLLEKHKSFVTFYGAHLFLLVTNLQNFFHIGLFSLENLFYMLCSYSFNYPLNKSASSKFNSLFL